MSDCDQLDPAAMDRLLRLGGHGFVAKMITLFGSYGSEKLVAAQAAQQAGNLAGVADAVHPIKSSAGNIGAKRVQALAQQIETLARESDGDKVGPLLGELQSAFEAAIAKLEAIKASHEQAASDSAGK